MKPLSALSREAARSLAGLVFDLDDTLLTRGALASDAYVALHALASKRLLTATSELVSLTREGLLRVDSLLPTFFLPAHVNLRYT